MTATQRTIIKEFKDRCRKNSVAVKNIVYLSSDRLCCDILSNLTPPVTCEVAVHNDRFVVSFKGNHMVTVRR
jgi:hypothetical protein